MTLRFMTLRFTGDSARELGAEVEVDGIVVGIIEPSTPRQLRLAWSGSVPQPA